ncbi:ABC-type uncharacterized transport system substrate-binding protein [Providencia alcalifaciens]|nr:ABC-type uncharacterized transport system substrate-binding protein [Providencia alcalifaciens]
MIKFKALIIIFCLFITSKGYAHPHSFIDMQVVPDIKQEQFIGLTFTWKMDPMTSVDIAYDLKKSKEGDIQWKKQAATLMANILAQDYFTDFYVQGKKMALQHLPAHYRLQREGLQVVFTFTVLFVHPFAVKNANIEFLTYDPTFFVNMTYPNNNAIILPKGLDSECKITLQEPNVADELRLYAYSLDMNQSAEDDDTLGLQFAQRVKIQCQ